MNKVILIGRLTKDPELTFTANKGTGITRFTLAVARQFKKDEADFISCVAFGKTAEAMAQYLLKGSQIAVTGSIRTGSYDTQDGGKRYTKDVVIESFDFIGSNKGNSNSNFDNDSGFDDEMTPVDNGEMPF